jgi:hypothetical protein
MDPAPWKDYKGNNIYVGDTIVHPSGERGKVILQWSPDKILDIHDKWLVEYEDGLVLRLSLQIGDKGQAVVEKKEAPNGHRVEG